MRRFWDDTGTATITDDDRVSPPPPPILPTLSIDDVEVDEDAGSAVFTVRLSERTIRE